MNLQTFKAPTMAEALTQVKSSIGSDAVILHTRTFHTRAWLGLRRREMVEITAGRGIGARARASRNGQPPPALTRKDAVIRRTLPAPADNRNDLLSTPVATGAAMLSISQEVAALKTMVKDLVTHTRRRQTPAIPQELFEYYVHLLSRMVAEESATELIKCLQQQVRPEYYSQPKVITQKLAEQLERLITTAGPITHAPRPGPHVVALVGPTGVGKTTTLAKLAANLQIKERQRVGLITLDTYRIAAVEQLRRYAQIIGAPLQVVSGAEELRSAARSMDGCEFILIDTAGRSPNDTPKLDELRDVLASVQPDEVHLVLSATASEPCLELAMTRFGEVRTDKIIFTKLDEAAQLGTLFNALRKVNKGLSYITTGQDVPDDIEVGQARRLAKLILGEAL